MKKKIADLKISLVQTKLFWEDRKKNLELHSKTLSKIKKGETDLIIFPETFSSGFTMKTTKVAEPMSGESVSWMLNTAEKLNAVVCGSLIISERNNTYNRLVWAQPDGKLDWYDKRHLFTMAKEHLSFNAGTKRKIVDLKGWKISLQVCYDLRFPVWARNQDDYDVLLYVANWPERRRLAWQQLLIARAIENQAYCIGVNRVGKDGNEINCVGDSVALDPMGLAMTKIRASQSAVVTTTLNHHSLMKTRRSLPFLKDGDTFRISPK
jgi:omega-amidase